MAQPPAGGGQPVDWRRWVKRWDAQQQHHVPDREERFTTMLDALAALVPTEAPAVLDLGCGPGSLAARVLRRWPAASVVAVDSDPVLLALAAGAYGDIPGLRFVDADLADAGRAPEIADKGPFDAAVSTTALHWLTRDVLAALYSSLAGALKHGGVFLDGDHRYFPAELANLERAAQAVRTAYRERMSTAPDRAEEWSEWWDAVLLDPGLARQAAERERRGFGHAEERVTDEDHARLLRDAGFSEVAVLWQRGDNRVLAAVR